MPGAAIARTWRACGHTGGTLKLEEVASAALPPDVCAEVMMRVRQRWGGARLYMPLRPRDQHDGAAGRFAQELRVYIGNAGGTGDQADEILTALSGGYFWI